MVLSILFAVTLQPATAAPAVPCNRDAIVAQQVSPDYPQSARTLALGRVTAVIRVYLTPQGKVAGVRVVNSTGNADVDRAALRSAGASTYLPRMKKCKPAFGLYLFKVMFDPNQ